MQPVESWLVARRNNFIFCRAYLLERWFLRDVANDRHN
jgi:hypothetical protein